MIDTAPFVNKSVAMKFCGAELRFDLSHALFSSFDIDQGTRLLLKAVGKDPALARARRILDEGCGTGVIGLSVAKAFPEAELVLRDRDSLALAFSKRNRLGNRLKGRSAWTDPESGASRKALPPPRLSWGLLAGGGEGGPFDYVLSNLPAKAGSPVLAAFFARLPSILSPGGRAGVVIVNSLAEAAASWIAAAGLSELSRERGSGHTVYIVGAAPEARPAAESSPAAPVPAPEGPEAPLQSLDLAPYERCSSRFKLATLAYSAAGFYGLPEFDSIGFGSSLSAELASRAAAGSLVREALLIEPSVGHLALWIARVLGPVRITAASRDLLALAATGANLAALPASSKPAYRALDALRLDELPAASFDFLAEVPDIVPECDWIAPAWDRAFRLAKSGATYLAVCPPTELARFGKRRPSGWRLLCEKRRKGFAAAAWRRN